jgi:hypothetical protein
MYVPSPHEETHIYEFECENNYVLATGDQVQLLRSQRTITEAELASVEVAKSVGISNKATYDLMTKEAGGIENLGFTCEDVRNQMLVSLRRGGGELGKLNTLTYSFNKFAQR